MSAERRGLTRFVAGAIVHATALDDQWQVGLSFGSPGDAAGEWKRYMTVAEARKLAAQLVEASDHYDAETARLAQGGAA